ncbi:MAG: TonB family protein [Nitrospirae bacterium]|nr:TonB family protein [Nitrospirota bacterium]
MYTVKHQPRYVLPKAYTVKLVTPAKAASVQPSMGTPQAAQKPPEKEHPPAKEDPVKAAKYEVKEPPKPVATPRPEAKKAPEPVAVKPETKKPPPKDTTTVEDRIAIMKSKKKLEQHAMLRSVIDLSKKDTKMGQSPAGTSHQSTSPSFGDAVNNDYSDIVGNHIRKRWAYPESAKKGLEAIVVFSIRQDGRIEGIKLDKSSGNSFFDRSALSAVNKSVPMPQPPLDSFEVGIRFTQ